MLVVFSLLCVLRVCFDYHVFVSVGFRNICVYLLCILVSFSSGHSPFLMICISAFIGFLIYAEALAYASPEA